MKKFIITFLGIIFLLPVVASAGSYCVSFPTGGGSKWTKRDNTAGVRFRYDYERKRATAGKTGAHSFKPDFFVATGVLKGSGGTSRLRRGYTYYENGTSDLCIEGFAPQVGTVFYEYLRGLSTNLNATIHSPVIIKVRLDVKWGGDCETVSLDRHGIVGNHRFELYRRKGNLPNPWGCRRK